MHNLPLSRSLRLIGFLHNESALKKSWRHGRNLQIKPGFCSTSWCDLAGAFAHCRRMKTLGDGPSCNRVLTSRNCDKKYNRHQCRWSTLTFGCFCTSITARIKSIARKSVDYVPCMFFHSSRHCYIFCFFRTACKLFVFLNGFARNSFMNFWLLSVRYSDC